MKKLLFEIGFLNIGPKYRAFQRALRDDGDQQGFKN